MKRERPMNWIERLVKAQASLVGMSLADVAGKLEMSPQAFHNRLKRINLSRLDVEWLKRLATALHCKVEVFIREAERRAS